MNQKSDGAANLNEQNKARKAAIEKIRAEVLKGMASGISDRTPEDILADAKKRLRENGRSPTE